MILTAKKHKRTAAAVLTGVIVVGGGIGYSLGKSDEKAATSLDRSSLALQVSRAIRRSQVQSCRASLGAGGVRRIEADEIQDRINQGHLIRPNDFPSIPRKRFIRLTREAQAARHLRRYQLLHVDCTAVPPRPLPPPTSP